MTPTTEASPTLENVRALLERDGHHAVLLPILARNKAPKWKNWPKFTYEETQKPEYQQGLRSCPNTGVLLGQPSDDLCTIDTDTEAAYAAFLEANPRFAHTLRTRGARAGQFWAYITGNRPRQIHPLKVKANSPLAVGVHTSPDPAGMVTIGEFRAEGGQSVIRGIHPGGNHYQWLCAEGPITIDFADILWPPDIAHPWEPAPSTAKRDANTDTGPKDQEQEDAALLSRAIATLDIDFLWTHFGYPDRQGRNPVASPFRTDNTKGHPSFSVFDQGRAFKDHNASYPEHRGDSFAFYQLATDLDPKAAFVPFVTLAGLRDELYVTRKAAVVDKLISLGFTEAGAKHVWHSIDHSGSIPELLKRACSQANTIQAQPATPPSDQPGNDDLGRNPSFRRQLVRDYGNNAHTQNFPPFKPWAECLDALSDQCLARYGSTQGLSWNYCTQVLRDLGWLGIYEEHFALPIHGPGGVVIAEQVLTPEQPAKFFITAGAGNTLSPIILGNLPLATRILIFCSGRELNAFADRSELYRDPTTCLVATRGHPTANLLANIPWPVALQSDPTVFLLTKNDSRSGPDGLTNSRRWSAAARTFIPFPIFLVPPPAPHHDFVDYTRASASKNDLLALLDSYEHGRSDPLPPPVQLTLQQQIKPQDYQLRGGSPLYYLNRGVHSEDILVGNGWLERGSAFFLVAQSGIGKSHIVEQICCCWACGKGGPHAFFLNPFEGRSLRIVIIQNEDSQNDLYRQSLVLNALDLSQEQLDLVRTNLWIETLRGKLGTDAIQFIRRILDLRNGCDLVVLNPLSAYVQGDLTRTEDAVEFLYGQFSPLLDDYQCGGAAAHHTPKSTGSIQKAKPRWSSYDFMYSGAGAATLTNFARAYITIDPKGSSQVFDVRMAKRFAESGWPTSQQLFKWAERKDCPLWVPASAAEAEQAQAKTLKTIQDLRKFVPTTGDPIPCTTLEQDACKKGGFTQKAYRAVLDEARSETTPDNLRLYYWKIYNPQGGTFAAIARSPQPEDQKPDAVKARIKAEKRQAALNQSNLA